MKTLQEIYDQQDATHQLLGTVVATQALSATTAVVRAGFYDATNLQLIETNLAPNNIRSGVTMFGVTGAYAGGRTYAAAEPKSGQTATYRAGDDGNWEKGVELPDPRFSDNGNGTVTDHLTGLMWVRAPLWLAGNSDTQSWSHAIDYCNSLDYAGHTDWRLPNLRELRSLLAYDRVAPALPMGHPFRAVPSICWTASTAADDTGRAWQVVVESGFVDRDLKATAGAAWPVRGGQ